MKIFLSVGATYSEEQERFVSAFEVFLSQNSCERMTVGRGSYTARQPILEARDLMESVDAIVVLAFTRTEVKLSVEKPGSPDAKEIRDVKYPTIWNQLEAAMAFGLKIPLLVVVEQGLHQEAMLRDRLEFRTLATPLIPEFFATAEFKGVFADFKRIASERARGKSSNQAKVTLKQQIEENLALVIASVGIACFVAGWGVPELLRKNNGVTTIPNGELARLQRIEVDSKTIASSPQIPVEVPTRVAIVDNVKLVYDLASLNSGRTNFDDIFDGLKSNKKLTLTRVQTYEGWSDYGTLIGLYPDVVAVHASAFYNSTNANDEEKHLREFLSFVAKQLPRSKVIVYSRSIGGEDKEPEYAGRLVANEPLLDKRLYALSIPMGLSSTGDPLSTFKSAANTGRLANKIAQAIAN